MKKTNKSKILNFNKIVGMSKEEIKDEINKVLENFSDKALKDLLSYLRKVEKTHSVSLFDKNHLKKILTEDKELLKKLAQ